MGCVLEREGEQREMFSSILSNKLIFTLCSSSLVFDTITVRRYQLHFLSSRSAVGTSGFGLALVATSIRSNRWCVLFLLVLIDIIVVVVR